jgi:hypothetical protein
MDLFFTAIVILADQSQTFGLLSLATGSWQLTACLNKMLVDI